MESSAIIPAPQSSMLQITAPAVPSIVEIEALKEICKAAAYSGFITSNAPKEDITRRTADAFFVVMYGRELGIPAMTALRTIYVIDGKPCCSGQAMLSLMRRAGVQVEIPDPSTITDSATIRIRRPGGEWKTYTYTKDMAMTAGLWSRGTWNKYPREMLLWRCISMANRFETPDVSGGMYTIEELAPADTPLNADGEIVQGHVTPNKPNITITKPAEEPTPDAPQPESTAEVVDFEQARKDLGAGHGPVGREKAEDKPAEQPTTEAPANPKWYTDNREAFLDRLIPFVGSGTLDEREAAALKLISKSNFNDYATGKAAYAVAEAAWNMKQKPAQPKNGKKGTPITDTEATILDGTMWDTFNADPVVLFEILNIDGWEALETLEHADAEINRIAVQEQWPVVAQRVRYVVSGKNKYLKFETPIGELRAYGRSTTFKGWVGDTFYDENGFEHLDASAKEAAEIDPVLLTWEAKDGYNAVTNALPVASISAVPDEAAAEPDNELSLNDYLNGDVEPVAEPELEKA